MQTSKAFVRFYRRDLHSRLFTACLRRVVLDENSCSSIFIRMFWSHYWPAFRLWAAMRYMLQSTLGLMWPLLLTHWQCNLTKLMTCSMTSLREASHSLPRLGESDGEVGGGMVGSVNLWVTGWPLWRENQIALWFEWYVFVLWHFSSIRLWKIEGQI